MKSNIMAFINTLEGFKTGVKNAHWSATNMNEHKLCDDIADELSSFQDEIAEIAQGLYGQIKKGELKSKTYKFKNTHKLLTDISQSSNAFYKTIKGDKFIGMRSVTEAFLGNVDKFQYLLKLCIKEERQLTSIVTESINNYLKNNIL